MHTYTNIYTYIHIYTLYTHRYIIYTYIYKYMRVCVRARTSWRTRKVSGVIKFRWAECKSWFDSGSLRTKRANVRGQKILAVLPHAESKFALTPLFCPIQALNELDKIDSRQWGHYPSLKSMDSSGNLFQEISYRCKQKWCFTCSLGILQPNQVDT